MQFFRPFILSFAIAASALVYTPRIQINHQIDFYSLNTILQSILKPGMTPQQKAEAIWRFSMDNMFHYKSPEEGLANNSVPFEMNTVEDPLKLLNVYGYAYCFSYVTLTSNLWRLAGLDSTRIWGIFGHLVSEVYYDGGWHYYDADQSVSACFLKDDGKTVACVEDLEADADKYIVHPKFKSSPNMPFDGSVVYAHESRTALAEMFRTKDDNYIRDRYGITLHQMDYYLRKNESLTLFFDKQGRWRHNGMDFSAIDPVKGPYDAHGSRTYSNGLFKYQPNLGDPALPAEGFYASDNVKCTGILQLKEAEKPGEFVIKVSSPYIIAGTPVSPSNDIHGPVPYSGAAIVSGHVDSKNHSPNEMEMPPVELEILVATKNAEYKSVYRQKKAGYFSVDLSEFLSEPAYYYFLKIVLKKDAGKKAQDPFIDKLGLETWVMVNPASIPRLESGVNNIAYSAEGPVVDKVDVERCYNTPKAMDFLYASTNVALTDHASRKYVQKDTAKPASLIFEMNAPENDIRDFYACALFHMREGTRTALYYSEKDSLHWIKVVQPEKLHNDHWAEWLSPRAAASPGVRRVYFKVTLAGGPSLSLFNFGYRYQYRPPSGRVEMVQSAEVDGVAKEFRSLFEGGRGVTQVKVDGKNIVNRYLRFECH